MAKSWRSNSEILYPIASKHVRCPWFHYFYGNQSQTSPVPSVSFQHPECTNVARRIWPKRTGENNDCLKENKWLNKFPIVSLIKPMWWKKKSSNKSQILDIEEKADFTRKKERWYFLSLFYVRHCGMHFRLII